MTNDIDIKVFVQMIKDAGLDFKRRSDVKLFEEACGEYQGDNITRDISQVIANAASKKPATEALNNHFDNFREQERSRNAAPPPQPKEAKDQTATEGLDQYFAELRTKIKKEG